MMDAETIAAAVVRKYFPPRRYAVCQNVSWALIPYEADIIAVTEAGTVHEVEIKISKADLLADAKKPRWRMRPCVDFYWLAVPQDLRDAAVERATEIGAGVFSVFPYGDAFLADKIKLSQRWITKDEAPLTTPYHHREYVKEWRRSLQSQVWRLAAMRYWDIVFERAKGKG